MQHIDKHQEYLLRLELAKGHAAFGKVGVRKEPSDDEGGEGSGTPDLSPESHAHPLLSNAAQFSGDFKDENPNVPENPEAAKRLQLELQAQLDKKLQAQKSFNPTLSR